MLFATFPLTYVLATVAPIVSSEALFFIVDESSCVIPICFKYKLTLTMHLAVKPFPLVASSINPRVGPYPLHFVVEKFAVVGTPVCPVKEAFVMLFSLEETPSVLTTSLQSLRPLTAILPI